MHFKLNDMIMWKLKVFVKYLLILFVGAYLLYIIITLAFLKHRGDFSTPAEYTWIFKDSIKKDINDLPSPFSYVARRDIYNNFHYQDTINVIIWEFKDLNDLKLNDISFIQNSSLYDVRFKSGQTINKYSDLEITMRFVLNFNKALKVNLSKQSVIIKEISAHNYKGFYGTIDKMSFSNEENKNQILFTYTEQSQSSLLIFFKKDKSWFLILINSFSPLDEDIVNILNLE